MINVRIGSEEMILNEKWTGNEFGDLGASKISESLMKNTTLTVLDL